MSRLRTDIEEFLDAAGYRRATHSDGGIVAERAGASGTADRIMIWIMEPDASGRHDEAALLAEIEAAGAPSLPPPKSATRLLVVPSTAGLSAAFRERIEQAGVAIRVPVQLFDTPYKADGDAEFGTGGGDEARSVFAEFLRESASLIRMRVPQPFVAMSAAGSSTGGFASGGDLLAHLAAELAAPRTTPRLTVVLGHAGAGKSVLFAALFAARHRRFLEDKRGHRDGARPILFLPAHIRDRQIRSLDGLLDAAARTEAAAATSPRLMRWLNEAGRTSWMFDGLDEFFAGEGDFVAALDALIGGSGRADVLLCTRDSLMASSEPLRALIDRHMATGRVRLYELARWDRPAQRALAHVKVTGKLPDAGATDPPAVRGFLDLLDGSPAQAEMATLPFYCDLMLDMHATGDTAAADEFELLDRAVDRMIDREAAKLESGEHGFSWDVFSGADNFVNASELVEELGVGAFSESEQRERLMAVFHAIGRDRLVELIEEIAHMMRTAEPHPNESRGLPIADLEVLGRAYLDVGLMPNLEPRVLLALVQLCFFAPGRETGHVRFAHEIIGDYLAAHSAARILALRPDSPDAVSQAIGQRADLAHSVFLRTIVHLLRSEPDIAGLVSAHVASGRIRPQAQAGARILAEALELGRA